MVLERRGMALKWDSEDLGEGCVIESKHVLLWRINQMLRTAVFKHEPLIYVIALTYYALRNCYIENDLYYVEFV